MLQSINVTICLTVSICTCPVLMIPYLYYIHIQVVDLCSITISLQIYFWHSQSAPRCSPSAPFERNQILNKLPAQALLKAYLVYGSFTSLDRRVCPGAVTGYQEKGRQPAGEAAPCPVREDTQKWHQLKSCTSPWNLRAPLAVLFFCWWKLQPPNRDGLQ